MAGLIFFLIVMLAGAALIFAILEAGSGTH